MNKESIVYRCRCNALFIIELLIEPVWICPEPQLAYLSRFICPRCGHKHQMKGQITEYRDVTETKAITIEREEEDGL